MAIYFPATAEQEELALDELTPREIVNELDKYVVGQHAAKRAVAIALRNRMRRQKLSPELSKCTFGQNALLNYVVCFLVRPSGYNPVRENLPDTVYCN